MTFASVSFKDLSLGEEEAAPFQDGAHVYR